MLSAHGIANQNVSRVPGMQHMLGGTELPETGAFDFFNYLLGLQVNSGETIQGQDALFPAIGNKAESTESQDPLRTLFEKKEQPLWNPLVPVGNLVAQPNGPHLVRVGENGLDVGKEKQGVLSDRSNSSKTVQENQLLESRLLEPAFFIQSRTREIVANSTDGVESTDKSEKLAQFENGVSDVQKSKGIEKYTELSQLKTQSAKDNQRIASDQTVGDKNIQSRIAPEATTQSMGETKSSEKKRDTNQDSPFVVFNSSVHTQNISNGGAQKVEKPQVTEKATLPEVFKKVESMIHHGGGKMTVELSPPELGKLEVDVVTKGNQVEIKMRSDNDIAKVTLESHMGELKNAMEGQNLTLHKAEVQVGLGQGHTFQEGRQSAAFFGNNQGGFERQPSQQFQRQTVPSFTPEVNLRSVSLPTSVKHQGGVDIRI